MACYTDDENGGANEVRYAALTVGGETKKYYRFETADDGVYDYYDETGKSAKKFLVRKPVAAGMVTSRFGPAHPSVLHVSELHSGVDWGAPFGTPIFAAGTGDIEEIGLKPKLQDKVRILYRPWRMTFMPAIGSAFKLKLPRASSTLP